MFWKNHSLSMEYFLQKCSWQQFLKSSSFCEYCSMLKVKKKELNEPFLLTKTRKTEIMEFLFLKCFWKFMDTISHSDPSLHRKFYMHQENNAFYDKKNANWHFWDTLKKHWHITSNTCTSSILCFINNWLNNLEDQDKFRKNVHIKWHK